LNASDFVIIMWRLKLLVLPSVKPVYSGHMLDQDKWTLNTGGLYGKVTAWIVSLSGPL